MDLFCDFDGPAARNHLTELVIGSQFDRFNTFVANPPKKLNFPNSAGHQNWAKSERLAKIIKHAGTKTSEH